MDLYLEYEKDRTTKGLTASQTYAAVSAKYSLDTEVLDRKLQGSVAISRLFFNDNYSARPDNSGVAYMRYNLHFDLPIYYGFSLSCDNNFVTDSESEGMKRLAKISEWDFLVQLAYEIKKDTTVALVREIDKPLDGPGMKQSYLGIQITQSF